MKKLLFILCCAVGICAWGSPRYKNITPTELMEWDLATGTVAVLDKNWKFTAGDDLKFAALDHDDSQWKSVQINTPLTGKQYAKVWYRNTFELTKLPENKNIQLDMGYISAGDQVYLNGVKCGEFGFSKTVNGSSNRYRRYCIDGKKVQLKAGKNVLAVRVKNGFKRGMYRGVPRVGSLPDRVVFGDLSTRSRGKSAVFRQVTAVKEVNCFEENERFFIRPQLALAGDAAQLAGEIKIEVRKDGKTVQSIAQKVLLQNSRWLITDAFEIKNCPIGKYKVSCSFTADGKILWQQEAEFAVTAKKVYALKLDKALQNHKKLPLQIGENSFGSFGLRDLSDKNELFDNYNTPDARGALGNVLGINKKYPGAVLLHSNVKRAKGFRNSDFVDQIGAIYDGLINCWSSGWIRPESQNKLQNITTEFSGWTAKRIRFAYPQNIYLDLSYSQLSPAFSIRSNAPVIRFFENAWSLGGASKIYGEKAGKFTDLGKKVTKFEKNYLVFSFRKSANWDEFDIPYLMVFEKRPAAVEVQKNGVTISFDSGKTGSLIQLMPLYGVTLQSPEKFAGDIQQRSRFWSRALLAMPEKVVRTAQVDYAKDSLIVRDEFVRQIIKDEWNTQPLKFAPVPPSVMLAAASGLDISISQPVKDLDYAAMNGPFCAVENSDSYVFAVNNSAHLVTEVRKVGKLTDSPAVRDAQKQLEKHIRNRILPEIATHPWQRLVANKSGKANSSGTLEPDFTNLMMAMKFLPDELNKKILKEVIAEQHNFFDNDLMAKARVKGKTVMMKVNRAVYNPLSKKSMNALNRHSRDNGIDCPCYEALRMHLAWSLGYYCNQWQFVRSQLGSLEKSFNLVVNAHDWAYSLCWDSYSGCRIGNGLQESTIFHAGFAGYARVMDKLGNKAMRDLAAYYSLIHLVGMTGSVGKATGEYVRSKRPYLAAHSLSDDIDFLEKVSHDRYCEINERGGLFSWVITPRNMFSGSMIMTHLPEVLRPYKDYWGEFSTRHFSGKLNGRMYSREVPTRVDVFCYAVPEPPFPVAELFQLRLKLKLNPWLRMADYRAFLEYNSHVAYEKQW